MFDFICIFAAVRAAQNHRRAVNFYDRRIKLCVRSLRAQQVQIHWRTHGPTQFWCVLCAVCSLLCLHFSDELLLLLHEPNQAASAAFIFSTGIRRIAVLHSAHAFWTSACQFMRNTEIQIIRAFHSMFSIALWRLLMFFCRCSLTFVQIFFHSHCRHGHGDALRIRVNAHACIICIYCFFEEKWMNKVYWKVLIFIRQWEPVLRGDKNCE